MKPLELPYTLPVLTDTPHEHSEPDTPLTRERLGARLRPERAHRPKRHLLLEPLEPDSKRNLEETE